MLVFMLDSNANLLYFSVGESILSTLLQSISTMVADRS